MENKKSKFTDEQLSAVEAVSGDILISAAAGSGKTTVLVERLIRMIMDTSSPVNIGNILALTFTKAAASNMRMKIMKAIEGRLETAKGEEKVYLSGQYNMINQAAIMTIDAFCLDVVRKNFRAVNIDPNFKIGDNTELAIMRKEVLDEVFEEFYSENDEGFIEFINAFSKGAYDNEAFKLIINIYEEIQSQLYPLEWLEKCVQKSLFSDIDEFMDSPIIEYVKNDCLEKLNTALNYLLYIKRFYEENKLEISDIILNEIVQVNELISAIKSDIAFFYDKLSQVKFDTLRLGTSLKKAGLEEYKDILKNSRDKAKKIITDEIIKEYFLQSIEYYFEQTKDVAKYTGIIYSVIKRFDDMYMQRKKEKSLFSFSDISHFCLNILIQDGKPSEAADVIRNKYTQIVIDEYQDINKIQDIIIEAVSGKDIGENNRFMVGDIKQSIYRFRLAEPKIFLEKYHSYSEDKESTERRIDFTKNFRSRENVIDSVNYLFKMLMSDTLGGVDYSDKKSQLYAGADYPDYSQYPDISELSEREKKMIEASEFYIIDKDSEEDNLSEDDEDTARIEDMKNSEVEASLAAKRIRKLIESEFKIYDKENKKWRTVTYGDIVILLLYPKDKAVIYSKILEENGIPAYTKSDAGFFDLTEIMTVTDILKIIDNPLQDIEMISVMYSPIFSFSADELLEIKLYDRKKYIYNNMKSIAEEYIDESEIKTKIKNFLAMYDRWKEISVKLTISELLERIYNESNYYNYIGILFDGKIKQANLDKLIKKSEEFENGKINCLTDFIKYAQQLRENKGTSDGEAVLSSENNDVVRITSIHKSKGLEFPVVIIGGLAARFNMNDLKAEVLTDDEIGVGLSYFKSVMAYGEAIPKYKEKTLMHNVIRMILKRETYSEELRVLYVALTRAEEKLILIGTSSKQIDKKIADISSNYLEDGVISAYDRLNRSSSFFDWIAMALSRHISGECLRGGVFEREKMYDESKWHIEILKREECVSFNKEDIAENKSENMNIQKKFECFIQKAENMQTGEREKIFSNLSWVYPYSDDALLPSKESISQIKRMNLEMLNDETAADNISLKRPRFSDAKESFQAAVGYGTAYHEVLEFIDFSVINSIEDVKREKERILAEEKIAKETADKVDERKIYRFISSEIGQRIRNTKKVYKETPFVISLSPYEVYSDEKYKESKKGILVNGIIDLYFEEKGKIILVDYKTDSVKKSSREDILKRYAVQLKIYKKALEKSTGKEVSEYGLYLISVDEFLRY